MYVCMYIYTYIYIHTYIHIYIYIAPRIFSLIRFSLKSNDDEFKETRKAEIINQEEDTYVLSRFTANTLNVVTGYIYIYIYI